MHGINEIRFNQATMREVVERYLVDILFRNMEPKMEVTDVTELTSPPGDPDFRIQFQPRKTEESLNE